MHESSHHKNARHDKLAGTIEFSFKRGIDTTSQGSRTFQIGKALWLLSRHLQYAVYGSFRHEKEFDEFGLPGKAGGGGGVGGIAGAGAGTRLVNGVLLEAGDGVPGPGARVAGPGPSIAGPEAGTTGPEAELGGETAGALDPTNEQP